MRDYRRLKNQKMRIRVRMYFQYNTYFSKSILTSGYSFLKVLSSLMIIDPKSKEREDRYFQLSKIADEVELF